MYKSLIADNTRRIINDKGLKMRAVAYRAGFSDKQFSALLNGRKIARDIDIFAIANALEVTPNELFGVGNYSAGL